MLKRLQIPAAAVVGLVLLAGATAGGTQEKPAPRQPAQEQKQEKRVRGAMDMADGQIETVTCKHRTLNMAFDNSYEILHLHTDNYFKVNFSAINFTPSGSMNPCKRAQGMYARPRGARATSPGSRRNMWKLFALAINLGYNPVARG